MVKLLTKEDVLAKPSSVVSAKNHNLQLILLMHEGNYNLLETVTESRVFR